MKAIPPNLKQMILNDAKVRIPVVSEKINMFFPIYFPQYLKYPCAPMHDEILNILGDPQEPNFVMAGFRSCAKSSLATSVYPIWAVTGKPQKKFVVIVAQTQPLAKKILKNIKTEFESNDLLKQDFGEFEEEGEEWASYSLILPKYGAKITAVSIQESVRGMRYQHHRPDLILFDDIEDLASVKTKESRDNTFERVTGEFLPGGDKNTRFIMIGNLLHHDSIIMRFKDNIELNQLNAIYREYPLLDANNNCLWPGKYPTQADIDLERNKIANEKTWMREYLLTVVPDDGQIINHDWIQYYNLNSNEFSI